MSKNLAIFDDGPLLTSQARRDVTPGTKANVCPNVYTELIDRVFVDNPAVVAIISTGDSVKGICEGIASELSGNGRRVVLVSVHALLHSSPISPPDETAFMPGHAPNVWLWPSAKGQQLEFFKSCTPVVPENWLDSLRGKFDAVLLDCPALQAAPGGAAISALADAAVLAVGARIPKTQLLYDQRVLQLSGVKLAGCILINPR
jgi:hypothetical protein